jgi:hypothetical protein
MRITATLFGDAPIATRPPMRFDAVLPRRLNQFEEFPPIVGQFRESAIRPELPVSFKRIEPLLLGSGTPEDQLRLLAMERCSGRMWPSVLSSSELLSTVGQSN